MFSVRLTNVIIRRLQQETSGVACEADGSTYKASRDVRGP
jgi:hypothetical protein